MDEGWTFTILPWQAEKTWPTLPDFVQRALNVGNGVTSDLTEFQVAIQMSESFEGMQDPNWAVAESISKRGNPRCASYIGSIRTLVEQFGGGAGAPLIREQDSFAKTLQESRRLGEDFLCSSAVCAYKATNGPHHWSTHPDPHTTDSPILRSTSHY